MVLRLVFCGLFAVCCSRVYSEDISSLGPPGSILVFGDEFNEAALDTDMWGFGIVAMRNSYSFLGQNQQGICSVI